MIGYLDIETSFQDDITVVGLLRHDRGVVQLVGSAIQPSALRDVLQGLDTICTFNGERFDLPVLHRVLGLDLMATHRSLDLFLECRRLGIRGGLKAIEANLGISRGSTGINGYDAMLLWDRWRSGDREALDTLLAYNRDDVVNLVLLERRLSRDLGELPPIDHVVVGGERDLA